MIELCCKYLSHSPNPPTPFIKEADRWEFSKMTNVRDQKFLLEMGGGSQEWGDRDFLKSLYIVGRGVLTSLFYEDPLYIAYPLCFSFFPTQPLPPLPCHLQPHPQYSFCWPLSLDE